MTIQWKKMTDARREPLTREQLELLVQQIWDLNDQASGDAILEHDAAQRVQIRILADRLAEMEQWVQSRGERAIVDITGDPEDVLLNKPSIESCQKAIDAHMDLGIKRNNELVEAQKTIARLQHEKDDAVFRNKILRERPDLPIERIRAYDTIMETVKKAEEQLAQMKARKDGAYLERNQVVAALAKCFPSGVAKTAIEGWSEDWHGCVYIDLPIGQVSWHFHDSHAHLFDGLPAYTKPWDGHTTEEKYQRLSQLPMSHTFDGFWGRSCARQMTRANNAEQRITILRDALMKIACANEPSDRDGMIDVAVEALLKTNKGDSNGL